MRKAHDATLHVFPRRRDQMALVPGEKLHCSALESYP